MTTRTPEHLALLALVDAAPEGVEKTEALRKLFNYEKSVGLIRFHEANPEVGSRF